MLVLVSRLFFYIHLALTSMLIPHAFCALNGVYGFFPCILLIMPCVGMLNRGNEHKLLDERLGQFFLVTLLINTPSRKTPIHKERFIVST